MSSYLEKKYNVTTARAAPPIELRPIQIAGLDYLFGGGLPIGRIVEFSGAPSTGKSASCFGITASLQAQGYKCAYIDGERSLDVDYLIGLGVNVDELLVCKPRYGEEAIEFMAEAMKEDYKVVIYDSVPAIDPKAVLDKFSSSFTENEMGGIAKMFSKCKGIISQACEENEATVLFINQIRDKVNSRYGGVDTPGGHALKHMCSVRIQLPFSQPIKDRHGITSQFKVIKNKSAPTVGRTCEMELTGTGIDKYVSLISVAEQYKLLQRRGNFYFIPDELAETFGIKANLGNGSNNVANALAAEADLYDLLMGQVLTAIKTECAQLRQGRGVPPELSEDSDHV